MCSSPLLLLFLICVITQHVYSRANYSHGSGGKNSKDLQNRSRSKYSLKQGRQKIVDLAAIATSTTAKGSKALAKTPRAKRQAILSVLLPWLYFMSTSLQIPSLPKYVNYVVNKGDTAVTPESAAAYGMLQGIDSLFTFLSVNAVGLFSDKYGRKPFMMYSSAGLGAAFAMILNAQNVNIFYLAAAIDGCSSCMLSQAQAYVADITGSGEDISIALGQFQGVAVGEVLLREFI